MLRQRGMTSLTLSQREITKIPLCSANAEWLSPSAEPTRNDFPLTLSQRGMNFPFMLSQRGILSTELTLKSILCKSRRISLYAPSTRNDFPLTLSQCGMTFTYAESTRNDFPLMLSQRRITFPLRWANAEWLSPYAEPKQNDLPLW